jgi:outer membrane protein TolC
MDTRIFSASVLLLAAVSLGHAAPLRAQDQTLAALLVEADAASPRIAGARRAAEAAAARVPQAGALPDPMVGLGLFNMPVRDLGFGSDEMTMTQVQVGAELPWPGKLRLREDVARLEAEAARWDWERVRQEVRADVESTYYEIYFVERALDVATRNEMLLADLSGLTSSRYGVGAAGQGDVLRASVERTLLSDQLVVLTEQRVSALAGLNALLGRATDTEVSTTDLPDRVRVAAPTAAPDGPRFVSAALADGPLPSVAELQRLAIEHNPMLQAHLREVEARRGEVALAAKDKLPDFNVSAGYSFRSGLADFFDLMVSAPIPIFSGRRQSQAVIEQAAVLAESESRHHAMVDELNREIASRYAELRRARAQLVLLAEGVLPQARTGLASATASYQVGGADFLTLLDAQAAVYRHELEYHRLLSDYATSLSALELAVGTEVIP